MGALDPPTGTDHIQVEILKPSHYDDDGYVIQWWRAFIPSNSLACVRAMALDVADSRALGDDVTLDIGCYDESHTVIPTAGILAKFRRVQQTGGLGVVLLVGVQSNQFPRAVDLARPFLAAGMKVIVGGFHVSGCVAMLPELPADIQEAADLGMILFAGELEGRMAGLLRDLRADTLQPIYNYMNDLPALENQVIPFLPVEITSRYLHFTTLDAGRGCPFECSFCTIINVQGRKSRYRTADDVEKIVRTNVAQGVRRFFITDDNFARNKNWEPILDRLIEMRKKEGLRIRFFLQVDTLCHRVPGFIEKATAAGCNRVFLGLENINPANLKSAGKRQNRITEYRTMLQAWRDRGAVTYAGYILGFPADTPESIERDIRVIQKELPIDILELFLLTPLPGSADHQRLAREGVWMHPDMNRYDLEHATVEHTNMSLEVQEQVYERSWHQYYSREHRRTLIRRAGASGAGARRMAESIMQFYGTFRFERVHPLQGGILRRKNRTTRRPGVPRVNPVVFYPLRAWELVSSWFLFGMFALDLLWMRRQVQRDPARKEYTDLALTPVTEQADEDLEMFEQTKAARAEVAKRRTRAAAAAARMAHDDDS